MTMPETLQSFKAGDKLKNKAPAKPAEPEKASTSAGFPRVEALIDEYATADQAKEVFAESIAQLEGLLAVEKAAKKRADITRAKKAFEHAMNTLDYLFSVKNELAQNAVEVAAKGKK